MEVQAAERTARRQADYDTVKARRDELAKEFAEQYPSLVDRFCDLFRRARAIDHECSRINSEAAAGEHRYLDGVELTARGLESFSFSNPALSDAVKLPEWKDSGRLAWPPPKPPLGALVAAAMTPPHDRVSPLIGQLRVNRTWRGERRPRRVGLRRRKRVRHRVSVRTRRV